MGVARRWNYGNKAIATLPHNVFAGFLEGENAAAVYDSIRAKLNAVISEIKSEAIDRFHLFVTGPEICESIILR